LEPIAKAAVSIRDHKIETRTTANGEFELSGVPPGEIELYVTTVGYAVIRKKLDVGLSTAVEVEILLGPDVIRRTDEITVTEKPFVSPEPAGVSNHLLTQADIRNLASVLIDDPLRSLQALPGVSTGDDFYAQFSARGAGFRSIGYATDGILLYAPMYEVGDINDGATSIVPTRSRVVTSLAIWLRTVSAAVFNSRLANSSRPIPFPHRHLLRPGSPARTRRTRSRGRIPASPSHMAQDSIG